MATFKISRYESVHQLRRNVMWERPLSHSRYSRSGRPPCRPQSLGTVVLYSTRVPPQVWPSRIDRFSPSFYRRNFLHAGEPQPALFSLSTFNFSADGTQNERTQAKKHFYEYRLSTAGTDCD